MEGHADFERCFQALKEVGYHGFVTFEDFSSADSSEEKLKTDINYIKGIVEAMEQRKREDKKSFQETSCILD